MKNKRLLPLCIALILTLSACGKQTTEVSPTPSATPTASVSPAPLPTTVITPTPAAEGPLNPLTGLPIAEADAIRRPVAIMLNNLKRALPQQGQSRADIIYECLEEGGITRMMGLYQSMEGVGTVGSIRSARTYYLELALGHDAIFVHAGGSEDSYAKIKAWGVAGLDGVRGPYMSNNIEGNLMWRDPDRKRNNGSVHSVVTTGAMIQKLFPNYSLRLEHQDGFAYRMNFADDGTPTNGVTAQVIKVPFSNYKTGCFTYDAEQKRYMVEEYGNPYIDGNTNEQVGVTNVIVVKTTHRNTGDELGHITIDLSSGGTGYFACGGKLLDILWTKSFPDGQLQYTDLQGNPITFGRGNTYVNIIPTGETVEIT